MGLTLLTIGFIVVSSLVFAAFTVSSRALWAFPIIITMWTAFLWMLIGRGVASLSTPPHPPRRVFAIILGCSLVAIVALVAAILVGLLLAGPRMANL